MSINDRTFDVYVVLGDPKRPSAWTAAVWAQIAPFLDPLVAAARGEAAVRTTQLRAGAGTPNQAGIRFGRIGWNSTGHRKWVHGNSGDESIEFVDVDVWAPSWTACQREDRAPDLFFRMRNEQSSPTEAVTFNPVLLLAVAADLPKSMRDAGLSGAAGIADVVSAVLRARRRRNWGYRLDHPERENALQDYSPFRGGPRNDQRPSLQLLEKAWDAF
jgi:hypothetical protein